MPTPSLLRDALYAAGVRQMQQDRHATLSDSDLDAIEAQVNDDTPIYVLTLIRELREARQALALLAEKAVGRTSELALERATGLRVEDVEREIVALKARWETAGPERSERLRALMPRFDFASCVPFGREGGGVLLNQCPHQLDLLTWICGMPVAVRGFCQLGKYHNIEVDDDVTAYMEFANGATGGGFIDANGRIDLKLIHFSTVTP